MNSQKEALVQAFKTGEFLETVRSLSLKNCEERDDLSLEIAALHNEGSVDVLSIFENLKTKFPHVAEFFFVLHVFERALPQIDAPVIAVMRFVIKLSKDGGYDRPIGSIVNSFEKFCAKDPVRPHEALKAIETDPDIFTDLLSAIIAAGSNTDCDYFLSKAVRLCSDEKLETRRRAVYALGVVHFAPEQPIPEFVFDCLAGVVSRETDDDLLSGLVKSLFALLQRDKNKEERTTTLLRAALERGGECTLHAAAEIFGFRSSEISTALLEALVTYLKAVEPNSRGTLDVIGHGIAQLLAGGNSEIAIELLESILLKNPSELTLNRFAGVTARILETRPLLNRLLTRWFRRGDPVLCQAVYSATGHHHENDLILDIDPAELNPVDLKTAVFVARKAIGFLFVQPVSAASVVISLMRLTTDDETLHELGSLLFDPVLLNYPGKARSYVEQQVLLESGKVKDTLEGVLKAVTEYFTVLNSVGTLPSLHPGQAAREAYYRNQSRAMAESYKAAEANSIISSIASKSILLYGRKSIDYIYSGEGSPRRIVTYLQSHGTTIEVPRLDTVDSYGLEFILRVFRMGRLA